jgi:hypothetical protein
MANRTARGFVGQMFQTMAQFIAPLGMPSPLLWGEEDIVRKRLGEGLSDLSLARRLHPFEYPFGPAGVVELFRRYYGPAYCAFASLSSEDQRGLQQQLETHWSAHSQAGPGATRGCGVPGSHRYPVVAQSSRSTITTSRHTPSRRACFS